VQIDKKSTGGPPAHRGQQAHQRSSTRVLECSSSERSKNTDALKKLQWLDNARSKYRNTLPEPCDTSSSGFRPRTVQDNAGYTSNMAATGSLEPHQAFVHHGMANEVVRTTHDALLHSALKRCARGLECTQHSVHSKS